MAFFTTDDGIKLFYADFGEGAKTVVFVHGLGDTHYSFVEQAGTLAKNCRVVAYDQRGHGASDSPKTGYSIQRMAKDLRNLIEHLGLEHVVLVGYSLGVHVIFEYVEQFGEAGVDNFVLTVMSPKLITDEHYKLGLHGDFTQAAADKTLKMLDRFYGLLHFVNGLSVGKDPRYKAQLKAFHKRGRTMKKEPFVQLQRELVKGDYWPTLDKMAKPTLVIAGDGDIYPVATQEAVAKRLAHSKLVIIPDATHTLLLEKPVAYMRELHDFIL